MIAPFELALSGECDYPERHRIERELGEINRFAVTGPTILDLRNVPYFDLTLLNALARTHNRLIETNVDGDICVVLPPTHFGRRLFELTRLDTIFRIFDDMTAARYYARAAIFFSVGDRRARYVRMTDGADA